MKGHIEIVSNDQVVARIEYEARAVAEPQDPHVTDAFATVPEHCHGALFANQVFFSQPHQPVDAFVAELHVQYPHVLVSRFIFASVYYCRYHPISHDVHVTRRDRPALLVATSGDQMGGVLLPELIRCICDEGIRAWDAQLVSPRN